MSKAIIRKHQKTTVRLYKEIITNYYEEIDFDDKILNYICDYIFDDWEYAQDHGVYFDQEDELQCIKIDMMLDELHDRCIDRDEEEECRIEKEIVTYCKKWKKKDYTIWFK